MKKRLLSLEHPCSLCITNLDNLFNKNLLSVYHYDLGNVLGPGDRPVVKTNNIFNFMEL